MKIQFALSTILLVLAAGSGYADPPPYEDEDILGLEISGELLAPSSLVSQIAQDLSAIRTDFPEMNPIEVFPTWEPGHLTVSLTADAWVDYLAGTFAELDSLNSEYGATLIQPLNNLKLLLIDFAFLYNPVLLGEIYEGIEGVRHATPNIPLGDGNDISCDQLPIYTFKMGWGDCSSSCIYADYWVFSAIGGTVELLAHYGSSVSAVGPTSASLSHILHEAVPNPFNPSTTIKYHLTRENWVRLEIFDLRGRPIIELVNEYASQGEHEVSWYGVDNTGYPVGSGVYFCRLTVDGVAQVQKMTLLK